MRSLIGRVGGKSKLADRLIQKFPEHKTYVEPFVGGGSVYFKKPPSEIEVINDKDVDVMNIYKDIRKVDTMSDVNFSPLRSKFNRLKNQTKFKNEKDRLYRNLYLSLNSFRGNRSSYIGEKMEKDKRYKNHGQKFTKQNLLDGYKNRLKDTKIHSQDYQQIVKKYDSPDTFIYLDPPYSRAASNRDYKEVGVQLEDICQFLKTIKGKFMMSYDSEIDVKKLCPNFNYYKINTKWESVDKGVSPKDVTEYLITNYKL